MVYGYDVKKDGKLYKAGEEVPENGASFSECEETETSNEAETVPKKRGRKPKEV